MSKYKHAVYIGRFQPIHLAHLKTIEKALEKAENLIIFVGSHQRAANVKNPFSSDERITLIKNAIKEHFKEPLTKEWRDKPYPSILDRIHIINTRDYLYNNYNWASEVYAKALRIISLTGDEEPDTSGKDTLLIGCLKDDSSYYLKMFPQWAFEKVPYMYELDATHIRNEVYDTGSVGEYAKYLMPSTISAVENKLKEFATEYKYYEGYKSMHSYKDPTIMYKPIHNTADCVVIKSGCILLIKRKFHPGKNLYALPGGFLNPQEHIKDCAIRELKEETRIAVPESDLIDKVSGYRYFDHPQRSLRGRVITHVFTIDLGYGPLPSIKEGDDAKGAEWVPIADIMNMEDKLFEDHYDIIVNTVSKY